MIPELGHFALILALGLCVILSTLPLIGASKGNLLWMNLARPLSAGIFVFLGLGLVVLGYSFVTDDFSVAYVAQTSNTLLPLKYKLTAIWGGHEGSFLLWTFMLSGWMLTVAVFSKSMPLEFVARVLAVLGMICFSYILFMLATSNPFDRIVPLAPSNGEDLNSALQDFGFIVHPPTLYMGYVGFAVVFSFAIAALISGRLDSAWARWSRPWAAVAWAILTVGIALGSWWAYYELGWGGWWAWDPVENPPLITWLLGTALLHSLASTEKRGVFKSWTVLLAILAFSGTLLGTFITRSGLLTSVHAFASDPSRGLFILAILAIAIGGSLTLFAIRAPLMKSEATFDAVSKESLILANNVLLVVASASVFLGTLFPVIYQALTDDLISIGPPYFNAIFVPLMGILVVLMGFASISRWKKTSISFLIEQTWVVAATSAVLGLVLPLLIIFKLSIAAILTVIFASWIVLTIVKDIFNKTANKKTFLAGLRSLQLSYFGMQIAHFGVAVLLVGAVLTSNFSSEKSVLLAPNESVELGDFGFVFHGTTPNEGPNYIAETARFTVLKDGREIGELFPEKRLYLATGSPSTEMAIDAGFLRDLFITLGEEKDNGAWSMTIYVKPFVRWVWLASIVMFIGGFTAAFDKRYRRRRAGAVSVQARSAAASREQEEGNAIHPAT